MILQEQILELREKGYSYNQIVEELGCSKSTVAYHCGEGQKEKNKARQKANRIKNPLVDKLTRFRARVTRKGISREGKRGIDEKVRQFQRRQGYKLSNERERTFTTEDLIAYLGPEPKCYLTGVPIDLSKPSTYNLDHIVPASKGGDNSLSNVGICTRDANMAKCDLELEEFLELCYDILLHWEVIEEVNN